MSARMVWMIYGASGYTGNLIARRAVESGHRPILAGRDAAKIENLAKELDCPWRIFTLRNVADVARQLDNVSAVLNCAGPFAQTAKPMIEACLLAGTNYLDITGEIDVIEFAASQHERAVERGIYIMPATGFDVVPSDCLAARLAAALPDANSLEIAFTAGKSLSPGTAKTMLAGFGNGGRIRRDGRIVEVPVAWETKTIRFPSRERHAVTIPWGDVASAYYTTQIPNITVYSAMPQKSIQSLRRWRWALQVVGLAPIQWLGRKWIDRRLTGPGERERSLGRCEFWGRVTDELDRCAEATLATPEGYGLTVQTSLAILERTQDGHVSPGFSTPAKAFGGDFIEQFEDVRFVWVNKPTTS